MTPKEILDKIDKEGWEELIDTGFFNGLRFPSTGSDAFPVCIQGAELTEAFDYYMWLRNRINDILEKEVYDVG